MYVMVAAVFAALGVAVFVLGQYFRYVEIATLGGILVLGVGALGTVYGFEYATHQQTVPVDTVATLPLGAIVLSLGALLVIRSFQEVT